MTDKPAILVQIDDRLDFFRPAGVKAHMDEEMADQVRVYLIFIHNPAAALARQYFYRGIEMPITTTPGWAVRTDEEHRYRDEETGQFIAGA